MNRNRYIDRHREGTEDSQRLGIAFGQIADADFVERMIHLKSALDEFGGQVFISANRVKLNADGRPAADGEKGAFETVGYVFAYGHKSQIKGQVEEPDQPLVTGADVPEFVAEEEPAEEPAE